MAFWMASFSSVARIQDAVQPAGGGGGGLAVPVLPVPQAPFTFLFGARSRTFVPAFSGFAFGVFIVQCGSSMILRRRRWRKQGNWPCYAALFAHENGVLNRCKYLSLSRFKSARAGREIPRAFRQSDMTRPSRPQPPGIATFTKEFFVSGTAFPVPDTRNSDGSWLSSTILNRVDESVTP